MTALPRSRLPQVMLGRDIAIRPATPDDLPFVMTNWLRTYQTSQFAKRIDRNTYNRFHHTYATSLFGRGAVVATLPDDRDELAGFLCGAGEVLHYVYVKAPYRLRGIASALLRHVFGEKQIQFTHDTFDGRAMLAKRVARFNPYL